MDRPTLSRFFKWTIHDRWSPNQAWVKEIQLRAAVTVPPGYLPNHATRANESTVVASTGAEPGSGKRTAARRDDLSRWAAF